MTGPRSRRDVLRAGGLALLAGVAGCAGDGSDDPTDTSTTTTTPASTTTVTTDDHASLPPNAAWTYDLGGKTGLPPSLADGTLYAGRENGTLAALDPDSGDEHWTADAGVGFTGRNGAAPTVVDGHVYVVPGAHEGLAGEGYEVAALDAASGDDLWSHSVGESSWLTLLGVHDGRVLASTRDDNLRNEGETLVSLAPASGDQQWTGEVGDPTDWAVGAGGVYVAAFRGMRVLGLDDGDELWADEAGVVDGLHVAGDTLVTGFEPDDRPDLAGLDPAGDVRWRGPDWPVTSYAVSDGVVYAGGERVAAYDASDGATRWSERGSGYVARPPVGGRLFARLDSGIHARDPASGELLWGTNATLDSPLAISESLVAYVASPDDDAVPPTLVARNAADGETAFAVTFEDADGLSHPVVDGDAAFVATAAGRVYAFRALLRVSAVSDWRLRWTAVLTLPGASSSDDPDTAFSCRETNAPLL